VRRTPAVDRLPPPVRRPSAGAAAVEARQARGGPRRRRETAEPGGMADVPGLDEPQSDVRPPPAAHAAGGRGGRPRRRAAGRRRPGLLGQDVGGPGARGAVRGPGGRAPRRGGGPGAGGAAPTARRYRLTGEAGRSRPLRPATRSVPPSGETHARPGGLPKVPEAGGNPVPFSPRSVPPPF